MVQGNGYGGAIGKEENDNAALSKFTRSIDGNEMNSGMSKEDIRRMICGFYTVGTALNAAHVLTKHGTHRCFACTIAGIAAL